MHIKSDQRRLRAKAENTCGAGLAGLVTSISAMSASRRSVYRKARTACKALGLRWGLASSTIWCELSLPCAYQP